MKPHDEERRWDTGLEIAFAGSRPPAGPTSLPERLEIRGEVARGGIGLVLEAHDRELGRSVAVKVLQEAHVRQPELRARFVAEAQIAAQLQHPGVVPVYDLGLDDREQPWFSMKLVQGESFAKILDARADAADDLHRLLGIFAQICHTVAYAHARGVVHRDLKPQNVMVGAFGEVLVMDWGVAKLLPGSLPSVELPLDKSSDPDATEPVAEGPVTLPGVAMGTPAYMAPEQARGESARVDERADVFSLGALLLHILSGDPPYAGSRALQQAKRAERGAAMQQLDTSASDPALQALVRDCMLADPDDRPADAGIVAERIKAYLDGVAQRAREAEIDAATAKARFESERRSRQLTIALFTIGGLIVFGLVALFGWQSLRKDRLRRDVEYALQSASTLEGRGDFDAALSKILRAEGLVRAAGSDPDSTAKLTAARARVERRRDNNRLVLKLFRLRTTPEEGPRTEHEFRRALEEHGIQLRHHSATEITGKLRELYGTEIESITQTIETWAQRPFREFPGRRHKLFAVANQLDPDPIRTSIRDALATGSDDVLRAMATTIAPESESPWTLGLLSDALRATGQPRIALELLEDSVGEHPTDFWMHYRLAIAYDEANRPNDANNHAEMARVLRPGQEWRMFPRRRRRRRR